MELLEGQDPEKKKLIETSDRHRRAIEKEVNAISDKTEKMLINALIIGGSLALTYFVISSFSGGKKKRKKKKALQAQMEGQSGVDEMEDDEDDTPSIISEIGSRVVSQATAILLEIAKDKLAEYLESRKKEE